MFGAVCGAGAVCAVSSRVRLAAPDEFAAAFGEDGALHGAVTAALDEVVSEPGLAAWAAARR